MSRFWKDEILTCPNFDCYGVFDFKFKRFVVSCEFELNIHELEQSKSQLERKKSIWTQKVNLNAKSQLERKKVHLSANCPQKGNISWLNMCHFRKIIININITNPILNSWLDSSHWTSPNCNGIYRYWTVLRYSTSLNMLYEITYMGCDMLKQGHR